MTYQCSECGKSFEQPAKLQENSTINPHSILESCVCPFCQNNAYTQKEKPPTPPPPIEAVYVYDLHSGSQTHLNNLLAEGWQITGRYAKQYILKKPVSTKNSAQEAPTHE
ncbi:MAG: hypothetical protein LBH79_07460 [Nitrososphaerota archaeon]|jgi:DNA-directed RNA polymerase subunit RPC12/RpoP|nr:hypothetical protein [Nitrososphaerota archaeon]